MGNLSNVLENITGPIRVIFEPTINCNLRCPMCDRTHKDDYNKHKTEQLTTELSIDFLESLGVMGTRHILLLGGGEPLMHPDIKQYIEILKKHEISIHLWTNGTLINESNADFLAKYCDIITISLDSPHEEINDASRGVPGITKKILNGFKLLRNANKELYIRLHSVLSALNFCHLNDFIPLLKEFSINEIGGGAVNPLPFVPFTFLISDNQKGEFESNIDEFCELVKKEGIALAGCYNQISKKRIEEIELQFSVQEKISPHNTCLALWSQASIRPNGDVSVCCFSYKPILGNLHKMSFPEIWTSKRATSLRKLVKQGIFLDEPCKGCDLGNPVFTKLLERDGNLDTFNHLLIDSR